MREVGDDDNSNANVKQTPRLFDGPTGDVNMSFPYRVQRLLAQSTSPAGDSAVPAAVRASPLYAAIMRFADIEKKSSQNQNNNNNNNNQQQQMITDDIPMHHAGTTPSVGFAPVLPSSLARRGVGPQDPLLRRKLRKQQQQQQQMQLSSSIIPSSLTDGGVETDEKGPQGQQQQQQRVLHWSKRPLHAMTSAGWDVFREQVGIRMEIVSRGAATGQQQQRPLKNMADSFHPIRCWEEARLPLALGTIVSRRYVLPTPIQAQCVPLVMTTVPTPSGKVDVLGVAETGSGKTAAYLIPLLVDVLRRTPRLLGNESLIAHGPLALVMVPTRELAEQVTREALNFVHGVPETELRRLVHEEYENDNGNEGTAVVQQHNTLDEIRIVKVTGGEPMEAQHDELSKGAHVVVGTLGQLDALLQQRLLALGNTRLVVMDEADRMIEEHQRDTLVAVLERCPIPRQTIMFTATLSAACEEVALKYFSPDGFVVVRVPHRYSSITQVFEMMPSDPGVASKMQEDSTAEVAASNNVKRGRGDSSEGKEKSKQAAQLERSRHPLLHPMKFARLVTYLAYATSPIVVFANEKRTCDALYDELRAEANHIAAMEENFSLVALVGECPPALQSTAHDDKRLHNHHVQQRRPLLNITNLRSVALVHSEQSQAERRRLVELFRRGERRVLVTTDLLSRGLDVPNVSLVINYDMPRVDVSTTSNATTSSSTTSGSAGEEAVQKYIHRIGRTGRAGASGVAVSFLGLPSSLIQRAQQHVGNNRGENNNSNNDGDAAASGSPLQPILLADASAKTRAHVLEKQELTGAKNANELDENLLFTLGDDNDDDEIDEEDEEPPRSRQRMEQKRQQKNADDPPSRQPLPLFPHDEPLLHPLWTFLVSCVETNVGGMRGAELLRQRRCSLVQMPPALVALMMAFTRSSPYGAITK